MRGTEAALRGVSDEALVPPNVLASQYVFELLMLFDAVESWQPVTLLPVRVNL